MATFIPQNEKVQHPTPSTPDWLDVLFANRNQAYGAYILRRSYGQHLRNATLSGIAIFCLIVLAPSLQAYFTPIEEHTDVIGTLEDIPLSPPPDEPKELPPPPPPPTEKPQLETKQFMPPKVVDDDKVVEDDPPPTIDELKDVQIGTQDQEGEKSTQEAIEDVMIELAPTQAEEVKVEEPKKPEPEPEDISENEVFPFTEQSPEFPNGNAAMLQYLQENIQYPEIARRAGIEGAVFVQFVVNETGNITDPKVLRSIGGGCDEEALRVVNAMPQWRPGKQNGKPVKVRHTIQVRFKLR